MSFWWIWGIYFMDHVVLRNDFGMDKKLSAVSGGLGIVRPWSRLTVIGAISYEVPAAESAMEALGYTGGLSA